MSIRLAKKILQKWVIVTAPDEQELYKKLNNIRFGDANYSIGRHSICWNPETKMYCMVILYEIEFEHEKWSIE